MMRWRDVRRRAQLVILIGPWIALFGWAVVDLIRRGK